MIYLGYFWGILSIILALGAGLRFIVNKFYNSFIRGLSKGRYKKIIETTVGAINILEENHMFFAMGAMISAIFHGLIMKYTVGISFLGVICFMAFIFICISGVVYRFIYRNKKGNINKWHKTGVVIFIVMLVLHLLFS